MTGGTVEARGNWFTLISMWFGLLVGVVFGVRSSERNRRHGREACEKGLKVVRKVVIVLIGIVMVVICDLMGGPDLRFGEALVPEERRVSIKIISDKRP